MTDNLITWNLPNFITVGLMALLFGALLGATAAGIGKLSGHQFSGDGS